VYASVVGCSSSLLARPVACARFGNRAYVITPIHANAVTLTYSFYDGSVLFDGVVPITGATARINLSVLTLYHSLRFFGRPANITASLPYGVGNFHGTVVGAEANAYSGMLDAAFRFSVNLLGARAMDVRDFSKWKQKILLGATLKIVAPTGQYDPTKLLNYGEIAGLSSQKSGCPNVGITGYSTHGAGWFFTTNSEFFSHNQYNPGVTTQSESPVAAFEGHLSYDVKPRFWASLDGNFWYGGQTKLNGVESPNTLQKNSRVGGTVSVPVNRHQSLKFSYANGAYIRYGGNYQSISLAWQYSWLGRPR
jgi:hypothetical protein